MTSLRPTVALAALLAAALPACIATPEDLAESTGTDAEALVVALCPPTVTAPSAAYPTLQSGVDAVCPNGTVNVPAGTFSEAITVTKRVTIAGAGAASTTIVDTSATSFGAVTYLNGGGGTLKNVTLKGGAAGVQGSIPWLVGANDTASVPSAVVLDTVVVRGAASGVRGYFGSLTLKNTQVLDATGRGLDLGRVTTLALTNTTVRNAKGAGVYAAGVPSGGVACTFAVSGGTYNDNGDAGIALAGAACTALVDGSIVSNNVAAGVDLRGLASATIDHAAISATRARTTPAPGATTLGDKGAFGDGVRATDTALVVRNTATAYNARAGVSIFQCARAASAHLAADTLGCNSFAIDFETGALWGEAGPCGGSPALADDGGNLCTDAFPSGGCSGFTSCKAVSSVLSPLPAP